MPEQGTGEEDDTAFEVGSKDAGVQLFIVIVERVNGSLALESAADTPLQSRNVLICA